MRFFNFRRSLQNVVPTATIVHELPQPAIPNSPAYLADGKTLWLAYEAFKQHADNTCAVLRFDGVIDFHDQPINDQGRGDHPVSGLAVYGFHESIDSPQTKRWSASKARHWIATFKDNTLNIVAYRSHVLHDDTSMVSLTELLARFSAPQGK